MKDSQPRSIYLKEYKVPAFLIETTHLTFELGDQFTRVTSVLSLRRNPASSEKNAPLILNGVDLELESLSIDGRLLAASDYQVGSDQLQMNELSDGFELTCITRIKPQENTCLEGLYQSSGMYCTQCEAEGFRRITYYLDRPDVMASFQTKIIASKDRYPVLLSNGNLVAEGELDDGLHFAVWEDPFKKPCYLFALVAGKLHLHEDSFNTCSGREIALHMYVEHENAAKCDHAIASLKKSMTWDEEVYGREYDLDIFMIVAVNDFNMGAMENKGLNIFNSSCVLATPETTTDAGYDRVEGIVAHEYFHNWSGNRVTCRDWFQLSLKEGFTVFRDSEFTADMGSKTVKRIDDVTLLRTAQFAEDAGPMAHPVRPESYMEIANFYTLTVYEKGAEVVRMIHTLIGAELFRKGSDLYFERFDGQAVTTDDFVAAMEEASGRDLRQFRRWYEQAGTPVVTAQSLYDAEASTYTLTLKQHCPPSPGQTIKLPLHIPFALGLLDSSGSNMPLRLGVKDIEPSLESLVLDFTESEQQFVFYGVNEAPVPSLLRSFSAPVRLNYAYSDEQLQFLIKHDSDGFNRWDAGQKLALKAIRAIIDSDLDNDQVAARGDVSEALISAYRSLLLNDDLDSALVAKMLQLPSEMYLIELSSDVDVERVHLARERVRKTLAQSLSAELKRCYKNNQAEGVSYIFGSAEVAGRTLKNASLGYLLAINDAEALAWAVDQYHRASNMTDCLGALSALMQSGCDAERTVCVAHFYDKWKADQQVIELWFTLQAASQVSTDLKSIESLLLHPAFDIKNPNKIRAVIGVFAAQNLVNFHDLSGSGYRFLADKIIQLDKLNPQIASRLVTPLSRWSKYDSKRQALILSELERIMASGTLSKDVYEVVSKSLVR